MASALEGIKVLDMTQGRAGAIAAMFLCDNGARVIRVELPEWKDTRDEPGFMIWDRGKESICLDISSQSDLFQRLIGKVDVLIDDLPPSSEHQKALDYAKLSAINPGLIHCSITAYGKQGALKDEYPDDDLAMARMGILDSQPGFRDGPVHVVHPAPSVGGAILAAQGIVSCLYAREKTGLGRYVETSLMAGALLFSPKAVGENLEPRPFQLTPQGGGPFYSVFECADGEWVQIGCIHGGFVDIAAAVMGIAHVMLDPRYGDGRRPVNEEARKELFDIVADVMKTKPAAEWEQIFEDADVPFARVRTTEESMSNPQVIANDILAELDDPYLGHVTQIAVPLKFTETPGEIKGPRHKTGQNTSTVLKEFGRGETSPPSGDKAKTQESFEPPLKGVKVLEMTNVIAGPAAGKCLADLGADIIKMESHDGDISRPSAATYFLFLNSNKRSISVNTKTPEGMEIGQKLAAQSDIMLANMRPGATDRMGLSAEIMNDMNPGLIHAHTTAFGWTGPFSHRPGVDPLAQAWMGLQRAQGGRDNPPVFLAQLAPTDFTSGAMIALGAIMALYVRERTGLTQKVDSNLLNAGALLTLQDFTKYKNKAPRRLADKGQYGLSALHRLYETRKGWVYISAEQQQNWKSLCKAIGREDLPKDSRFESHEARIENDDALSKELITVFEGRDAKEWHDLLMDVGVPVAEVAEQYNIGYFDDSHPVENQMIDEHEHPRYGHMKYSSNALSFGNTERISGRPTPLLGQHNREALAEIGYSDSEVNALYDKGVLFQEKA